MQINVRTGPLPKVMPMSLETLVLNLGEWGNNTHKFTGGIPAEWSSMTNLKELNMQLCGLDGEFLCWFTILHNDSLRATP